MNSKQDDVTMNEGSEGSEDMELVKNEMDVVYRFPEKICNPDTSITINGKEYELSLTYRSIADMQAFFKMPGLKQLINHVVSTMGNQDLMAIPGIIYFAVRDKNKEISRSLIVDALSNNDGAFEKMWYPVYFYTLSSFVFATRYRADANKLLERLSKATKEEAKKKIEKLKAEQAKAKEK